MAATQLSDLTDPGADVLGTTIDDRGVMLAQTGDAVNGAVLSDNAEWYQHVGFASRPAKATPGKPSCQVFTWNQRSNDIVLASRDARCTLPAGLKEGETCLYAGGPNNTGRGRITLRDDGSTSTIRITTQQGNSENGQVVEIRVGSDGKIQISGGQVEIGNSPSEGPILSTDMLTWIGQVNAALTVIQAAAGSPAVPPIVVPTATPRASTTVKVSP